MKAKTKMIPCDLGGKKFGRQVDHLLKHRLIESRPMIVWPVARREE